MKFRKEAVAEKEEQHETREEMRELAEALSLYRSAMRHVAERRMARPLAMQTRPLRHMRLRLLLAPALAAAVAAGILIPEYAHHHHRRAAVARPANPPTDTPETRASVDDTVLMNQIDNELSEDVPDALRPLADLTEGSTTNAAASTEKKNVTKE